jgi:hypothetical protein
MVKYILEEVLCYMENMTVKRKLFLYVCVMKNVFRRPCILMLWNILMAGHTHRHMSMEIP